MEEFKTWTISVTLMETPPEQKIPSKTSATTAAAKNRRTSPFAPARGKQFFAVAVS